MDTNHKQVDTMLRSKHSKVPWNTFFLFLIAKYPVKVYFNAKVMMYEFVLVTKQTIYVYLSWQRILIIQDAESFGFVENATDTMKFMKFKVIGNK
jgi:hypothetical protein